MLIKGIQKFYSNVDNSVNKRYGPFSLETKRCDQTERAARCDKLRLSIRRVASRRGLFEFEKHPLLWDPTIALYFNTIMNGNMICAEIAKRS